MAATFEENSWVWIPDEEEQALPAKVLATFRAGEAGTVQTEDGEEVTIAADKSDKLTVCDPEVLDSSIDNLISLNDLNENAILHNLRIRFKQDVIYTNVSSILISVNPFKLLPLYTPEMMDSYRENARDLPPHVFKVADFAYRGMLSERADQAIVISGESGAGKSEATKLMLQYVADVSSRRTGTPRAPADEDKGSLEQQILQANPIMEAFGNAKTVRNNNSSRFGKLITVKFDVNGGICGGSIINYLLEKSRVVFQSQGERNYHIFYQLIAGGKADPALQTTVQLTDPEDYNYLSQSGVTTVDGMNDEKEFQIVRRGFVTLGMDEATEVSETLKTVAAVLHLGNIDFVKVERAMEEDSCAINNMPVLDMVAALLGLDPVELNKNLTSKNIGTRSIILVPFKVETAQEARDALVKSIYGALFQYIIDRINKSLEESSTSETYANIIGVLDIFGFESFEKNYFEQLCINFCNEKLQFHFNEHIFRLEQEVYDAEGVDVPKTDFQDNQPTLTLIEGKGSGILPMADEEINVPRGSDTTLLSKLQSTHAKHPNFKQRPPSKLKVPNSQNCFGVVHYAGEVYYDISKFLEKNKDQLSDDLKTMLRNSSNGFVAQLVKDPAAAADDAAKPTKVRARGGKKKSVSKTLGAQFKASLNSLMTTLNAAEPHFVRCMKPNKAKVGGVCEAEMILAQLRYSGLLEVCRIRKLGFPVRRDNAEFLSRYAIVVGAAADLPSLMTALEADGKLTAGQFALGQTKVFMKNRQAQELEVHRDEAVLKSVLKVQALVRGTVFKFKFRRCLKTLVDLRAALESREEESLTAALDMCTELPHGAKHLVEYQQGQTLLVRLIEERQLVGLVETALNARDKESLKSAIAAAAGMTPPFEHELLGEAADLVARLEKEEAVINGLKKAMLARDRATLEEFLREADELEIDSDEVRQAVALKARLEEEEATVDSLRAAIANRNVNNLQAFLSKCSEMGLTVPEIEQGQKLLTQLQAEQQAKLGLKDAVAKRDLDQLVAALAKAVSVGLADDCAEVAEAAALKATIDGENASIAKLAAATDARDKAAIEAGMAECAGLGLTADKVPQITEAEQMMATLAAEEACEAALVAALATNTLDALSAALGEASRLGLTAGNVAAVKARMDELSAAAQGAGKLAAVQASDSIEEVQSALAEAEGLGLTGDPAFAAVQARLKQLEAEKELVEELVAATNGNDSKALTACVVKGMKLGIANKYAAEFKAAKDKASAMDEAEKCAVALTTAIKSRDTVALDAALSRAAELNLAVPEVAQAQEAKAKFDQDAGIEAEITAALEKVKDEGEGPLRAAFEKAMGAGLDSDVVTQARVVLDRKLIVEETYTQIDTASESKDLNLLQKALETGIQLGLTGEKIDAAGQLRETLQAVVDEMNKIKAAVTVLTQKMTSTGGIKADDVATLTGVISTAEANGSMPPDLMSTEIQTGLADAKKCLARGEEQLRVQQQLQAVLGTPEDYAALKEALAAANNLAGLKLAALDQVRVLFKAADEVYQKSRELEEPPAAEEELDPEDARKKTEERYEHAKQARFNFSVYPGLRTPDDYAKSVILQKRKIKEGMLKWSNLTILRSLLDMDPENSKIAVQIHRSLLGYMGDKAMSFPATLAQDILQKGLSNIKLRNEIYMQVMKQLTTNPTADSIAKGWQIMCMCVSTFPCSTDFEDFLLHFMLVQREKRGAVRNYAKYCLRTLAGMLQTGTSGLFVPSVEEIQAYKERPPILATVEIVDGHFLTEELPVTPDLNVGKVVEICTHFLELTDDRADTMGIFVYDVPRDESIPDPEADKAHAKLDRTPRPLKNDDYMGDVIVQKARQKRNYKFVFKRKIFLPSQNTPSDDTMFNRLQFLQAEDEVITQGNLTIQDEEKVVQLSALSYRINFEDDFPEDVETLASESEFSVVDYIPVAWRQRRDPEDWATRILTKREELLAVDTEACQQQFVELVWDHELYGAHFFNVVVLSCTLEMERQLKIAFCHSGMWILDMDYQVKYSFGFADIYRWGGSSSQFSLIIWNTKTETTFELKLATAQAADMAGIILDYINAIMASQQGK